MNCNGKEETGSSIPLTKLPFISGKSQVDPPQYVFFVGNNTGGGKITWSCQISEAKKGQCLGGIPLRMAL